MALTPVYAGRVSHAAVEPRNNRTRLIILVVAILVVIAVLIFALPRREQPTTTDPVPPVETASAENLASPLKTIGSPAQLSSASATPSAAPSSAAADARLANCTAVTEGFTPDRYTIERFNVDEEIVALNLDADGNIAAPPLDEARMASWWSGGPQPGADRGKAVLSIHTYRTGKALGNELYADGQSRFQPGDVIKLYGDEGQVQCYEYTDAEKIFVDDYEEDSTVMVDFEGDPALTIVICWDFDSSTEIWESRVFFHFTPVTV